MYIVSLYLYMNMEIHVHCIIVLYYTCADYMCSLLVLSYMYV